MPSAWLSRLKKAGHAGFNSGSFSTDIRFTGQRLDSSTSFYYYGARYYDPELGRFIQPDTIIARPFDPQDLNRYSYCRNNSINYVDPTGHSWLSKIVGAILGFIVGVAVGVATGSPQIGFAVGMATFNAVDSGIAASQAGLNGWKVAGISLASAAASFIGSQIGNAFGSWAGGSGAGAYGASVFSNMFAGAAGGATGAALSGGNAGESALWGGAIGTGVGIMMGGLFATPAYEEIRGHNT